MKRELEDTLMYPSLEELRKIIPQKYELVLVATRRAKQIIREQRLNPGSVTAADKGKKPLTIALQDIAQGNIDKEALMAVDLEFDTFEEEQLDYYPEFEGIRPLQREFSAEAEGEDSYIDEEPDEEPEEEPDEDMEDDLDDLPEV